MKNLAAIVLMTLYAATAQAHSNLKTTIPENGAVVSLAPDAVELHFAKDLRLTRVELVHNDAPSVQLDLGRHTSFGRDFIAPLNVGGAGTYHIEWRGLGADGHAMHGRFSFTVE